MAYAPLIIAHRGHKVEAPEQTMAAFQLAIELGADMIEADVQLSRDGIPFLLHDTTLDRTTSGHGRAPALDWVELSRLDAGSWFQPAFAAERIPRLDDLFALASAHGTGLCLEAKGATPGAHAEAALAIAQEIARRGRLEIDVLASFDHSALADAVAATPGLRTAPDRLPERGHSTATSLVSQARAVGAHIIQHHFADLTPELVANVQAQGIDVWAWPPTTPEDIALTLRSAPAAIMGDDVRALAAAVHALAAAENRAVTWT